MALLKSVNALSINHQAKGVRHANDDDAPQSFKVVGDGGLVLGYYAVPNTDLEWVHDAMVEIVERHGGELDRDNVHKLVEQGDLPRYIYVDCNCCNGKEGGRTEANCRFYGMIKLLHAFYLTLCIRREINSEHDRKQKFM